MTLGVLGTLARAAACGRRTCRPGRAGLAAGALTTTTLDERAADAAAPAGPRRDARAGARHAHASCFLGLAGASVRSALFVHRRSGAARRRRSSPALLPAVLAGHLVGRRVFAPARRERPLRARADARALVVAVRASASSARSRDPLGLRARWRRRTETGSQPSTPRSSRRSARTATCTSARSDLRGPAPGVRRLPQPHPLAAAPRPALPPQAGVPAAGDRPADLGRRPELQPRVPRAPHGAAAAGLRGAAARARRAHPLAAAGPRQAAVGDVARAGARGQPLRADLQVPPRARRRHRGRRPDDRAVRRHAGPPAGRRTRASRGRAAPEPSAAAARRARRPGSRGCRSSSPAARCRRPRTRPSRSSAVKEALEGIGEVAWAGLNPAPPTPLNVPIGPHRRLSFVRNDLDDFKLVKDAFGGTVNDVVLTVVAGGAAALAALARRAHRGARAARAGAGVRARARTSTTSSATASSVDARAAAGLRRGPGRAAARRARRRWTA